MKKIFTLIAIVMMVTISSVVNAKTVKVPLKHTTDTKAEYVVFASGESVNQNTAREIAMNECYGQLARNLDARVKSAIKTYSNNYQIADKRKVYMDDAGVTERIITTISNTRISNMFVIETKVEQVRINGRKVYRYWVSMAMPKGEANTVAVESLIQSNIDSVTKNMILNDRDNFEQSLADEF